MLFDDISCGLTSNRKLKILDSTGMNHQLFLRKKNVTTGAWGRLEKR